MSELFLPYNKSAQSSTKIFWTLMMLCMKNRLKYTLFIYTEQNYKHNTLVFAPIFHELNSKI